MSDLISNDYRALLAEVKERIRAAQYAALRAVNTELIALYWDIGQMIVTRQQGETWGKSVVQQLAADLREEFPGVGGFSASNLWRMKVFHEVMPAVKNSHHWCEKSAGRTISSFSSAARTISSASITSG